MKQMESFMMMCMNTRMDRNNPWVASHTSVYISLSGLSCCPKGVSVGGGNTARLWVKV